MSWAGLFDNCFVSLKTQSFPNDDGDGDALLAGHMSQSGVGVVGDGYLEEDLSIAYLSLHLGCSSLIRLLLLFFLHILIYFSA